MLKTIGLAAITVCCTGMGMQVAHGLSQRVEALETALAVVNAITGELAFTLAPPDELVWGLAARPTFAKAEYLTDCAQRCRTGTPFPIAWRQAAEDARILCEEDRRTLSALADMLGQSDLAGQLAEIGHIKELLQVQLLQAREKVRTHAGLYRTLGALGGVFLVILWM